MAFEAAAALCRPVLGEGGEEARRDQPSLSAWAESEAQIP
jgi:hypothetical protein